MATPVFVGDSLGIPAGAILGHPSRIFPGINSTCFLRNCFRSSSRYSSRSRSFYRDVNSAPLSPMRVNNAKQATISVNTAAITSPAERPHSTDGTDDDDDDD